MTAIHADIDDTTVSIDREQVKASQVTMEMKEKMTHEEYRRFVEAQHNAGDDGGYFDRDLADKNEEERARQNEHATEMSWRRKQI